ncbi:Bacteriophytochrome cph2 [Achromobacter xylosoxidans]|nr:EAL domain-containing protein [Achromobacter sp. RW408]QEQ22803.1 EAL domain-containing protein [Achromobacter xylosoxidans]CUJ72727.1 Bacteriophytochrome cph2 [Achromobacter xylosoxidans]
MGHPHIEEASPTGPRKVSVIAFTPKPEQAREVMDTLTLLGITRFEHATCLDDVERLVRTTAIDVIVCSIQPGENGGLMLPSLLQTMRKDGRLLEPPRVLWSMETASDTSHSPTDSKSSIDDPQKATSDLERGAGISLQALQAHARLAQQAGISVGITRGYEVARVAAVLDRLLNTHTPPLQPIVPHEELQLEEDLIAAISGGTGLHIALQPQYDLHTKALLGAEALARWTHPRLGNISPTVFIPIVNRLDLNLALFGFVKKKVIEILEVLYGRGVGVPIAVNASVKTICTEGFAQFLAQKMEHAGLPNRLLKIELTEELPIEDPLLLSGSLNSLRALGFLTSLDDFGSGFATINLLSTMPFDEVKIDGSFVKEVDQKAPLRGIIATISSLARLLNMNLVAEGIEDESSIATLRRLGCNKGQGFALSKPLEPLDFLQLCLSQGRTA